MTVLDKFISAPLLQNPLQPNILNYDRNFSVFTNANRMSRAAFARLFRVHIKHAYLRWLKIRFFKACDFQSVAQQIIRFDAERRMFCAAFNQAAILRAGLKRFGF